MSEKPVWQLQLGLLMNGETSAEAVVTCHPICSSLWIQLWIARKQ